MNSSNNVTVMKDISRNVPGGLTAPSMQSTPGVRFPPPSHGVDPTAATAQSLYPQSYNLPPYDRGPGLGNPYARDNVFANASSSSSTLSFGLSDISPSLFGSGMLGSHPYHPSTHPLPLPPRTAPNLLNYGQPSIQSHTQNPLFPSPSPYPSYPSSLPMGLPHSQSMAERYLLSSSHMMPRFPGLHHGGPASLPGYGVSPDGSLRPTFPSTLLAGATDRKGLGMSSSPATNMSNGSEMDHRNELNNSRKKRKACGHCGPCQRKENCGSCMNCVNRAKGKQICIHRKCEVLKKKPGSTPYTAAPEQVSKHEKRKDLDDFSTHEPKRNKTDDSASSDLPQGLIHPTLHPNFAEFGDTTRDPVSFQGSQQLVDKSHSSANLPDNQRGNQSYFPAEQQNAPPPFHPGGFPAVNRAASNEPNAPSAATGPVNEESEFINQALQAIESATQQTPASPSTSNSLSDATNSHTPAHSQGASSAPGLQQLQSPQQIQARRTSRNESGFGWGPHDKPGARLESGGLRLSGNPATAATGSNDRIAEGQALPDQLLDNLRKYNSPTTFHGQSNPLKDPGKAPPYSGLLPQQRKGYAASGLQAPTTIPGAEHQNLLTSPQASSPFDNPQRQFSTGQSAPNSQQPDAGTNPTAMYHPDMSPYGGQRGINSSDPNCNRAINEPYSHDNGGYMAGNPAFPSSAGQTISRPFGEPPYPAGGMNVDPRFSSYATSPTQNPPGRYEEKPGMPGSMPSQSYQYPNQQPTTRPSFPHQQGAFRQPFNHQPFDQVVDQQQRTPVNSVRDPSATSAPEGLLPPSVDQRLGGDPSVPNGGMWGFRAPQPHHGQGGGSTPNLTSPPDMTVPQRPPSYRSASRRVSANMSGDFFTTPRHLADQPMSNGSGSCSPMVQSSPAGSGVVTNSPFSGSVGNNMRSPVSAFMTGSPASQYQGGVSSPSSASISHLSTSPNILAAPRGPHSGVPKPAERGMDPTMAPNAQKYRPWPEQPGPRSGIPHDQGPPTGKPDPSLQSPISTTSHFLALPGSSRLDTTVSFMPKAATPNQTNVAHGSPLSMRGSRAGDASFAAARLSVPDKPPNDGDPGRLPDFLPRSFTHDPRREFTDTMNSVLFGRTSADQQADLAQKNANRKNATGVAPSPTDAHSTISPGESGYDSAELSSVMSESAAQYHSNGGALGPSKDSGSMSVESALPVGASVSNERPKNAFAASVGSETQRSVQLESNSSLDEITQQSQSKTGLPGARPLPAEAAFTPVLSAVQPQPNSTNRYPTELPQTRRRASSGSLPTLPCSQGNSPAPATPSTASSWDSSFFLADDTAKNAVLLRRYSYQGPAPDVTSSHVSDGSAKIDTDPRASVSQLDFPFGSFSQLLGCAPAVPGPSSAPGGYSESAHDKLAGQTVNSQRTPIRSHFPAAPLDTPPQTPHGEFNRKISTEVPNLPVAPTHGGNITTMPTPPHTTDDRLKLPTSQPDLTPPEVLTSDELRGRVVTCKGPNNTMVKKSVFPQCDCLKDSAKSDDDSQYYTHLGAAPTVAGIRKLFEQRCGFTGNALRIEKVKYTGKEGKTEHGCPVAKWVLRRSSEEEKIMVVCRQRLGHRCSTAVIVLIVMLWEGIDRPIADHVYNKCTELIPTNGVATRRRCGTNDEKTCACQGFNDETGGASFSFGCSWSMYYNGCKYARSINPGKFKLGGTKDSQAETSVENMCQSLATTMSRLYKMAAPDAHRNQVEFEELGKECRLGHNDPSEGRPFSGLTFCMDFSAHAHKDQQNMDNGSTIVLTLTKPELRVVGKKATDEQLHVLPLYRLDLKDEDDTYHDVYDKINSGAIEILSSFPREVRLRDKPLVSSKKRKEKQKRADTVGGTPKKKRGKCVKKCHSMDDVTLATVSRDAGPPPQTIQKQCSQPSWSSQPSTPLSPQVPAYFHNSALDQLCSPPPRWPYRRHPQESPSPVNSNLPSIGSFFSPGAQSPSMSRPPLPEFTPPLTPGSRQTPSPMRPAFHYGRRPSTASPALSQDPPMQFQSSSAPQPAFTNHTYPVANPPVVGVKREAHCDVGFLASPADKEQKIRLASYAAGVPLQMPRVKVEPDPPVPQQFMSNSSESFHDSEVGGVAIAAGHGSVLIECAKRELHATTSLLKPNRFHPSRVSLVFYQHKSLNYRNHGAAEYEQKEAKRNLEKAEKLEREAEEKRLVELEAQERRETIGKQQGPALHPRNPPFQPSPMRFPHAEQTTNYHPASTPPRVANPGFSSNSLSWKEPPPVHRRLSHPGIPPSPGSYPSSSPRRMPFQSAAWYEPNSRSAVPESGAPHFTVEPARHPSMNQIVNDPYRTSQAAQPQSPFSSSPYGSSPSPQGGYSYTYQQPAPHTCVGQMPPYSTHYVSRPALGNIPSSAYPSAPISTSVYPSAPISTSAYAPAPTTFAPFIPQQTYQPGQMPLRTPIPGPGGFRALLNHNRPSYA